MSVSTPHPIPPDIPQDLAQAVIMDAALDADRVALFLAEFERNWNDPVPLPRRWPRCFLFALAAALRLLAWEYQGIKTHREAGLPSANEALRDAFLTQLNPSSASSTAADGTLIDRVLWLFGEQFAWAGRVELNVEVTLGSADEETLLDALADFLWTHRTR